MKLYMSSLAPPSPLSESRQAHVGDNEDDKSKPLPAFRYCLHEAAEAHRSFNMMLSKGADVKKSRVAPPCGRE